MNLVRYQDRKSNNEEIYNSWWYKLKWKTYL